jgi:hypothetical protein
MHLERYAQSSQLVLRKRDQKSRRGSAASRGLRFLKTPFGFVDHDKCGKGCLEGNPNNTPTHSNAHLHPPTPAMALPPSAPAEIPAYQL